MDARVLIFIAAAFVTGAVAIALAGIGPRRRDIVAELWALYRSEFLITGFVIVPAALGQSVFALALLLLTLRGQYEVFRFFDVPPLGVAQAIAMLAGCALVFGGNLADVRLIDEVVLVGAACIALAAMFQTNRLRVAQAALLGLVFPALLVALTTALRTRDGLYWVLFVYGAVEVNDAFALIGGKLFGRRKLLPRLSPKKTVEGLVVGLLAGGLTGFLLAIYLVKLAPGAAAWFTVAALAAGFFGDIFTSLLKRWRGKKDFASVLPAHGGVLDIYDSLLFAGPVIFLARTVLIA